MVSVGDRVVDNVPRPVKEWAIDAFGTNDKAVLLTGVAVILAVFAAWIGILAVRRSLRAGLIGVGAFTLIGVLASLGGVPQEWPPPCPAWSPVRGRRRDGGAGQTGGRRLARCRAGRHRCDRYRCSPASTCPADGPTRHRSQPSTVPQVSAGVGAAAVAAGGIGRWLQQQAVVAGERLRIVLPKAATPLPPVPATAAADVPGSVPFITPTESFYRIDTALVVPRVSTDGWTLGDHRAGRPTRSRSPTTSC